MSKIGIIGGTGLYEIEGLKLTQELLIDTPFGKPSDALRLGELEGREVVFLARHGRGHRLLPTELNYKANIYAMKSLDVQWIISVSAVGSLRPDYKPQDVVVIDQFFDRTNQGRQNTFFGDGIVSHIQFAKPLCNTLGQVLLNAGKESGATTHQGGTYINIEGPAFSTLAESQTYRKWGMDVVGMTQLNEAKLAREAEICYATLAMITDYDCWYEEETGSTVSVDMIMEYLKHNVEISRKIIKLAVKNIPTEQNCGCADALANSFLTPKELWPSETVHKLTPILKKYL